MKNLKFTLVLVGAVLLGLIIFYKPQTSTVNERVPTQNEIQNATITVNFGDDNKISGELPIAENSTAFSLLQSLADSNEIQIETKQYDFGVFVEKINGKVSSADKSWIYFINGESGQVAADDANVKANDLVEWKYITQNE